jgi:putative heme-binding domain-containing protein
MYRFVIFSLLFAISNLSTVGAEELPSQRKKRTERDAPAVQLLMPGFRVRTLPLDLTNLVNLQYRPDGKLVALAYNGNIYLCTDTNGDGLEDHAELFWQGKGKVSAPVGMDLAPAGSPWGDAVFFCVRGKVMMVADQDHDGRAEVEKVLAEGWPLARAGVDTTSIYFDPKDGAVYFGLGVRWYDNAFELDRDGVAHNDLTSERGAILRISPDFKSREKLCTGVRWPICLRRNELGDLFCTDQEGATWLPNGNPFDELLVIEKGRHYGFPPRHPKHLPNVIDEPSVFDYGPQHQSTCGFRFNDGSFGPAWWKGDALVTGEARGKIWRTKLVKSTSGYVATTQLLACVNQLAVDVTQTPRHSLLVATHSGSPDWGTGPEGKGTILEIYPEASPAPQAVVAFYEAPEKLRVCFDLPVVPDSFSKETTRLEHGEFVRAGDRYESIWPGYEAIKHQLSQPVITVPVTGLTVASDRRSVLISVPAQTASDQFALTLGQHDLDVSLTGVKAEWKGADGSIWQGWLPHLDLTVARELTAQSAMHAPFWQAVKQPGSLHLETRLDLWHLLRPTIQPGAALDYAYQKETALLELQSPSGSFKTKLGNEPVMDSKLGQITHDTHLSFISQSASTVLLDIQLTVTGDQAAGLELSWSTEEDARPRALPLHRMVLPWRQDPPPPDLAKLASGRPELLGGDWQRGKTVFLGEKALCAKCHTAHGVGSKTGPDLSNLIARDYASVLRDISDPSATLNPDYLTYDITLKDGRQFPATMRAVENGKTILGLGIGAEITVESSDIVKREATKHSLMPAKLNEALDVESFRNLMTFLLTAPAK